MKKFFRALVVALSVLVLSLPLVGCGDTLKTYELPHYDYSDGDGTEVNRDLFYKNNLEVHLGDPTTLYVDGWFYTTGTLSGNDFRLWKSKDLTVWEDLGVILTKTDEHFGVESWWAPQLFWDPEADWQYYLGEDSEEGKGLYLLYYSARVGADNINHLGQYTCQLCVAFCKEITGPYRFFRGVNANGDYYDESRFLFDIEKIKDIDFSEWESRNRAYGPIYKKGRSFIDACPFIDPVSGDKYMYFVCNRYAGDVTNDIWGVKMKDWVTPDYPTVRPLTAEHYITTDKSEELDFPSQSSSRIDEGPFMHYEDFTDDGVDNGTYFLTFSLCGGGSHLYAPLQATATEPLGNFVKVKVADGGFVISTDQDWDIEAAGHHDFFYIGDEIWISYHSYRYVNGEVETRYWACDRVEFIENANGQMLMRANGPSRSIQPLPEVVSGYRNVARDATVTVKDGDGKLINDGYLAIDEGRVVDEYVNGKKSFSVTLEWKEFVTARAIMVYASYDWNRLFDGVEKIEFSVRKQIDGKYYYGKAVIKELGFNPEHNKVDLLYYALTEEEIAAGDYDPAFDMIRPCSAAVAEFDEVEINAVTLSFKKGKGKTATGISEIVVLGKTA